MADDIQVSTVYGRMNKVVCNMACSFDPIKTWDWNAVARSHVQETGHSVRVEFDFVKIYSLKDVTNGNRL